MFGRIDQAMGRVAHLFEHGPLEAGTKLGPYEIQARLGEGGMGEVYLAVYTPLKHRPRRVLKLISPAFFAKAGEQSVERFHEEANALGRLEDEGIVRLYEFQVVPHPVTGAPTPFMALEYVAGKVNLERYLEKHALTPREAAALIQECARAVGVAHQFKIVHRDLKPANILLVASEDGVPRVPLRPKVADFGIAKTAAGPGEGSEALATSSQERTQAGRAPGTLEYMAPEQFPALENADRPQLTPAADVWALGVILHQVLLGRLPFFSDEQDKLKRLEAFRSHIQTWQPEGLVGLARWTLPVDLLAVVAKCLHPDPARRYKAGDDLAEDLKRFLEVRPVQARPRGPVGRGWMWARRNVALAGLLAVILCLAAVGPLLAILFFRLYQSESQARERETTAKNDARENERVAQQHNYAGVMGEVSFALREEQPERALARLQTIWPTEEKIGKKQPDLRGWEAFHARARAQTSNVVLRRTADSAMGRAIHDFDLGPDGRTVALAGGDGEIELWNLAPPQRDRHWASGHRFPLQTLRFSPDGRTLVSVGSRGLDEVSEIKLWDVTGTPKVKTNLTHTYYIRVIGFVSNEQFAIAGRAVNDPTAEECRRGWRKKRGDGIVALWDIEKGQVWARAHGASVVDALACSPKGDWLVSSGTEAIEPRQSHDTTTVRRWRIADGSEGKLVYRGPDRRVSLALAPDGRTLAVLGPASNALYDLQANKKHGDLGLVFRFAPQVVFTPDGKYLATGSQEGEVRFWDTRTGLPGRPLKGHTGRVTGVLFHSDGTTLYSAGDDATVRAWDRRGTEKSITCLAPALFGRTLAAADKEGRVCVWNTKTRQTLAVFEGRKKNGKGQVVYSLSLSPDSRFLAVGDAEGGLRLSDVQTGKVLWDQPHHKGAVHAVVFDPQRPLLLSAGADGKLLECKLSNGDIARAVPLPTKVVCLAFSPGGEHLVSGGEDGSVAVWDMGAGKVKWNFFVHKDRLLALLCPNAHTVRALGVAPGRRRDRCSLREVDLRRRPVTPEEKFAAEVPPGAILGLLPDSGELALADEGPGIKLHDLRNLGEPAALLLAGGVPRWALPERQAEEVLGRFVGNALALDFSDQGGCLAAGIDRADADGEVRVWEARAGKRLLPDLPRLRGLCGVSFSADRRYLALGASGAGVRVYNAKTGAHEATWRADDSWNVVRDLVFGPDACTLAAACLVREAGRDRGEVKVWDVKQKKAKAPLKGHDVPVRALRTSRDRKLLASGSWDGQVLLWAWDERLANWVRQAGEVRHESHLTDLALAPDGRQLATAGEVAGQIAITFWDLADRTKPQKVRTVVAHTGTHAAVAFSPDGNTLASAGYDGWIRFWSTATGREVFALPNEGPTLSSLAFSPEGTMLAVGGERVLRLLHAPRDP